MKSAEIPLFVNKYENRARELYKSINILIYVYKSCIYSAINSDSPPKSGYLQKKVDEKGTNKS